MSGLLSNRPISISDADLKRQRQRIRRGLTRANTAMAVILVIVMALSLAALFQALRAARNARAAESASGQAEDQLWKAQLARAHAQRLSGLAGRRQESLAAVAAAAALRPSLELRNEAIAALALSDVSDSGVWRAVPYFNVFPCALAPDLTRYALGDRQGRVTLFDTRTGEVLEGFRGPASVTAALEISRDGKLLAAAFRNGEIAVWPLTSRFTGEPAPRTGSNTTAAISDAAAVEAGKYLENSNATGTAATASGSGRAPLFTLACGRTGQGRATFNFSPDGHLLAASCGDNRVRLFDLTTVQELDALNSEADVDGVEFRPDGSMLTLTISNRIELWRWPERTLAQTLPNPGRVASLAWHPDSRRLAVSCFGNLDIILWDTLTTNRWYLRGHAELVPHLAFNQQGDTLLSFSWDGSTRFWRAADGELSFISRAGFGLGFNRDGTQVAYMEELKGWGIWNYTPSGVFRELTLPPEATIHLTGFDFSPDGQELAIATPDGLRVIDLATGKESATAAASTPISVWFSSDSSHVFAVARNGVEVWKSPTSQERRWQFERRLNLPKGVTLDFGTVTRGSPPWAAVPAMADSVVWFDLSGEATIGHLAGAMGPLTGAAISADTNWVATTCWKDRGTAVWDTHSGRKIHDLGPSGGFVAFSPDSRWLLVGSAHQYTLWDTRNWRRALEIERRTAGELVGIGAFSSDSRLLALCPEANLVQIVETETGRELATLNSPVLRNIGSVMFSPDGKSLAASTFDNKIQLWDLPAMRHELAALGLDWGAAVAEAAPKGSERSTLGSFFLLDGLGALAALAIGLYTLGYHQRMVRNYEEIETLVAQRNRELELAQAELLHSEKMKALGTLAAGIAHDFNNLLSVIRMGNTLARRPDTSPEDKAESSAAVERAVEQGKKVVRSMLGYSREGAQGPQAYSVDEAVDDVVLLLNKQFLGSLTLTLELNRDIPKVFGVRGRLEQILLNLVVNASEAMAGRGRLAVAVHEVSGVSGGEYALRPRAAERYIELVVADTGPGIAADLRSRVFEPFFSTKARGASSGTGLGLSLVHSLAQLEGIGIRLESSANHGTEFTLLIPVAAMNASNEVLERDHPVASTTD